MHYFGQIAVHLQLPVLKGAEVLLCFCFIFRLSWREWLDWPTTTQVVKHAFINETVSMHGL